MLNLPYLDSHILADNIIEAFRRGWPETLREAPRFLDVSLPSLRILAETQQTLVDYRRFLTNSGYRAHLMTQVKDPQLAADFEREYNNAESDELKNIDSVRNKLAPFIYDKDLRRALGQTANHLNYREMMDGRKVLIVNLSHLAHGTQKLLGSLLTVGFEQAAFSRSEAERTPFYLYLDEFQRFCANEGSAETLATILSQCRKYGLRLILAHQQVDQVQGDLIAALGNVGVKVAFASEYEDARKLVHKFYIPGEGEDLPTLDFLVGGIQRLRERRALIKVDGKRLAAIVTEPIPKYMGTSEALEHLKTDLLKRHGVVPQVSIEPTRPVGIKLKFATDPKSGALLFA